MKEKGLTLTQASKFVKDNNLYQKIEKAVGAGNKSGRISRIKKANKWKDFSKSVVEDGMELGQKGLDMFNKQKDRQSPMGQVKRAFGGVVKAPSKWIMFVKEFASKNGISYKEALKAAGPEYRKSKEN